MPDRLASFTICAGELLQHVSRVEYRNTALHFGRTRANRYDSPGRDYGVLYLGRDLPTALMESVFHKHRWHEDSRRSIAMSEIRSRLVRVVGVVDDIDLVDHAAWPAFVVTYRIGVGP